MFYFPFEHISHANREINLMLLNFDKMKYKLVLPYCCEYI